MCELIETSTPLFSNFGDIPQSFYTNLDCKCRDSTSIRNTFYTMSTKFKAVLNETTGKTDFNFPAELVSISDKEMANSNGTKYVLGNVNFTYPNGQPAKAVTTQIFAKSLAHGIKVGSTLLSTLSRDDDGRMWIRTSHLPAGNNIDTDAFGSMFDEVVKPVAAEA